ncbi:MAG: hypothetical protein QXD44_05680 [Candidatus Nezhaarchaeales archaeon]
MEEMKIAEVDIIPLSYAKPLNCCEYTEILRGAVKVLEDYEIGYCDEKPRSKWLERVNKWKNYEVRAAARKHAKEIGANTVVMVIGPTTTHIVFIKS